MLQCRLCWNKEKCLKPGLKCVNRWSSSTVHISCICSCCIWASCYYVINSSRHMYLAFACRTPWHSSVRWTKRNRLCLVIQHHDCWRPIIVILWLSQFRVNRSRKCIASSLCTTRFFVITYTTCLSQVLLTDDKQQVKTDFYSWWNSKQLS